MDPIVITTQIQHHGPSIVSAGNRGWSSDTCDCCDDCKICACVFFCGWCYACYLSTRLGEHCCVPIVAGVIPLRLKLRMLLGIRGTICDDCCCLHWHFTAPCTLCQMAREMKSAGWPL